MQKTNNEIDWDQLRVFLAVVRAGQFLGAARRLGLDQATVTRRVRALEAGLGARLFDRMTTGSVPTAAGRELIKRAERIEAEVLRLSAELSQEGDAVEGRVRVGAPDGFGTLFLARRFVSLLATYPKLDIELVPLPRSFSLSKREVDLAVTVDGDSLRLFWNASPSDSAFEVREYPPDTGGYYIIGITDTNTFAFEPSVYSYLGPCILEIKRIIRP